MAVPTWLDPAAKVAEIVGAAAGVLALVFGVLDRGRPEVGQRGGLEVSVRAPRRWLRLSAGLFCIPLLALILQAADVVPTGLRASMDVVAALAGAAACIALVVHLSGLRRQRIPLPSALRSLINRQWEEAQFHQYAFTVGSAPPLRDIYVEQHTEQLTPSAVVIGDIERAGRLTLAQMLKDNRNAVVLAEPGVGKSTAVAHVLREQCSWWRDARRSARSRDAPYGAVVPIRLPINLHGRNSLPGAMAAEWKRLTGTDPDERMFERSPPFSEAWLVLIDGIDQILSTPARIQVLSRLGAWMSEHTSPYRLMVTTRPLLGGTRSSWC